MLASLERAREAERRFVGDASHELRTPLTALRGNAAYVARHGADPAVLADIEADAARLSALLDDLLALAREDAAAPAARRAGRPRRARRAAADADDAGSSRARPVLVRGERAALERAVGNLVRNARTHGHRRARDDHRRRRDGERVRARRGRGPRPAPTQAERAFERFWRGPARAARARASASRSCARSPSATAAASTVDGATLHDRAPGCQGTLKLAAVQPHETDETTAHRIRPPPAGRSSRLVVRARAGGRHRPGGAGTGGEKPAAQAARPAILDAVTRPRRRRASARASSSPTTCSPRGSLPRGHRPPRCSPAPTGRLWLDRRRPRCGSSCSPTTATPRSSPTASSSASTTRRRTRPTGRRSPRTTSAQPPSRAAGALAGADRKGLAKLGKAVARCPARRPSTTAGRPSYTVRIAPEGRRRAARRGRARLGRRPRHAAARRDLRPGPEHPVLELKATDISYGTIPASDVDAHAAGRREGRPSSTRRPGVDAQGSPTHVTGVAAVAEAARLPALRARPSSPASRASEVRLVHVRRRQGRAGRPTARASARSSCSSARPTAAAGSSGRPRRPAPAAGQHRRRDRQRAGDRARHGR